MPLARLIGDIDIKVLYLVADTLYIKHTDILFRGQESAGIATSEGHNNFFVQKGMGLVRNVFNNENLTKLKGSLGIGHIKYSTKSSSEANSCQPFVVYSLHGAVAVAHNGELVNCDHLRQMVCIENRF